MSSPLSVLQRAQRSDVRTTPFPFLIIRNALPAELCEQLIKNYPSLSVLGVDETRNNSRWSYTAPRVAKNFDIAQIWRDFVAYHVSTEFFHEIVDLFYDGVNALYPGRFTSRETMKRLHAGIRNSDTKQEKDILMDAQICGNTPVRQATSVRTTHIDAGDKLFSGLFYLRPDADKSKGGDLVISKFKSRYSSVKEKLSCFDGVYVDDRFVDEVETVRYEKNVLILFINSIDSLHGVSIRQPTEHSRIFLNLVGEVREPLYEIPGRWKLLPHVMMRKFNELVSAG